MGTDDTTQPRTDQRDFTGLLVVLAVAILAERLVAGGTRSGGIGPQLIADLTIWLPLLAGVVWFVRRQPDRSPVRSPVRVLGLRIGAVDVFAAIAIACVVRALDAFLSLAFFGTNGLVRQVTIGDGPDALTLTVLVLGTCIVSPVVEELFFRGAFQRRLSEVTPRVVAVLVSAALFAVAHVLIGPVLGGLGGTAASTVGGFEVFVTTFVLGALVGTLVAVTGRIGGAILAHVLFNAIAVALTWPV